MSSWCKLDHYLHLIWFGTRQGTSKDNGQGTVSNRKEIFEMRSKGYSLRKIASTVGVSHQRIQQILQRANMK